MILAEKAIQAIKTNRHLRRELGMALDFSEEWVKDRAGHNKNNGPLTAVECIDIIIRHTKLSQDEILISQQSHKMAS